MKILLIEPNYKNKYPPIGLMKISTYHKSKGDYVFFCKGIYNFEKIWDRIYITTLFTFDYDTVIKTIEHYKTIANNPNDIYVGGIAASLMLEKMRQDSNMQNILSGRLTNSNMIGFDDNINIDSLSLDYDILMDTDYHYSTSNSIISYTSRGCINSCDFCAVPILEGTLSSANSIKSQVMDVRNKYSDMKDLLLLDNNILGFDVEYLTKLAKDLNELGYVNNPTFLTPNKFESLMKYYYRQLDAQGRPINAIKLIKEYLLTILASETISNKNKTRLANIIEDAYNSDSFIEIISSYYNDILYISKTHTRKIAYKRYVDFNQGLDARELTEEKMKILSQIPINPYRFAFDNSAFSESYIAAVTLAYKYGIKSFSNYLLYNHTDTPKDLYDRIMINLNLSEQLKINIYSFPMKYAPITRTDRKHISSNWNMHFLRIFQSIINVTKGVVAGDRSFIERAFGSTYEKFEELLHMPHDFIVYRNYYEEQKLTQMWQNEFKKLSYEKRQQLVSILSDLKYETDDIALQNILAFYKMKYKKSEKSKKLAKAN